MNGISVFWQKRLIAVMVLVAVTLLNANGAPVFAQDEELKKRIEILEEKTRDIERMDEEEKGRWEELTGHVETLERELTMVDYRTGRIRAREGKGARPSCPRPFPVPMQTCMSANLTNPNLSWSRHGIGRASPIPISGIRGWKRPSAHLN